MFDPQKDYDRGTRNDCTRDNRVTICPNATLLGYGTRKAKRGSWIRYEVDNHSRAARVVGRVHCEGKTYLEVMTMDVAMTMAYVRWIDPCEVRECYAGPHYQVMEFMLGEWKDEKTILSRANKGFTRAPGKESA